MINTAVPGSGNRTRNAAAAGVELTDDVLNAVGDALGQVTVTTPTLALLAEPGVKH